MQGYLDIFEAGEVALGSEGQPNMHRHARPDSTALAHYMARMERNPSAARQKSTLTQLLEAVCLLARPQHGAAAIIIQAGVHACLNHWQILKFACTVQCQ